MKNKFLKTLSAATAIAVVSTFATVESAQAVLLNEQISASPGGEGGEGEFTIEYTLTHNGTLENFPIIAFAVDFGNPLDEDLDFVNASASRNGWEGDVLDEDAWNAGEAFTVFNVLTSDFGTYDSIFGNTNTNDVALFSFEDSFFEGLIQLGETQNGFEVSGQGVEPESEFIAICDFGQGRIGECDRGTANSAVPEPGTLGLLAFGIAGLGAMSRRRRKSA